MTPTDKLNAFITRLVFFGFLFLVSMATWCHLDNHHQESVQKCLDAKTRPAKDCEAFGDLP